MGLNFLGLGFSFGAKDSGLDVALGGVGDQFKQLNDSLKEFQDTASVGFSPAEESLKGLSDSLSSLGDVADVAPGRTFIKGLSDEIDTLKKTGEEWSLSDLDLDVPSDPKNQVDDLTSAMGGMAAEAALGGSKFGRMANSVLGGAGKITGAMGWVGLALGPIISGFGQAAESAGGMVDAATGIPARIGNRIHALANEGIRLTNSLEGEAVAFGQTARQVGVNMGYTGANLRRFIGQATGMAMGLNIGADEAARAIRAWDESAETLGATGLSSAQDVARLTAALGINADTLRNSTLEMRNLGASDEQIHRITSALALLGQRTGDVTGAMNELPQVMQMLERRRALGDTPEQMAAFAVDTAAAARGLFAFTQDSERARQMAAELAGTVTTSREAFQNMFAGVEDQLPQLVTELAVTRGQVDESFRLMQGGPGGLIEAMGQMVQATRAAGGSQEEQSARVGRLMEFMRGRLQQVFGPEMTATLINFWGTMDAETVSAMGAIRNASVDLGEMGREAHTTGRTLDEVFDRMRAGFQTAFRRIARPAVRDFVRDTGLQLQRLRHSMASAAGSSGALGTAMETLSLSSQIGGLALLPRELRGTAIAADELQGMVTPLITAFGTWGGLVETVGAYVALFATEVITAKNGTNTWAQAIDQVATRFADVFVRWLDDAETFITQFVDSFASFDWNDLFGPEQGEGSAAGAIRRVLNRIGEMDWDHIWNQLRAGLNNLFERVRPWLEQKMQQVRTLIYDRINAWWEGIDWGAVFSTVGDMAGALWGVFRPALVTLGGMIADWFSEHWVEILGWTTAALGVAVLLLVALLAVAIVAAVVVLALAIVGVIAALTYMIIDYFASLGPAISEIGQWIANEWNDYFEQLGGDLAEIGQWITNEWNDFWGDISDGFEDTMLGIDAFFRRTWTDITLWFRAQWSSVSSWFRNLWDGITQNVDQAVQDWMNIFSSIGEFFIGIGTNIRDAVGGAIAFVQERWSAFTTSLSGVWTGLSEGWTTFLTQGEAFWTALTGLPARIREGWQGMVDFFRTLFSNIRQVVGEDLGQVGAFFQNVADVGSRAFAFIQQRAEETHGHSIHTIVGQDMEQVVEVMTAMATQVSAVMQAVLHDATVQAIVTGFSEGFAAVVENMDEFSDSMVDHFTDLAEGVSGIMTELFTAVLVQAEATMLGTETAVEGIIGRLRTITQAQAALAEARSAAAETLARPADEEAMRRRMAQLEGAPVLQAIHNPDWYSGGPGGEGRGYRELFIAKMDELHAAIVGIGTTAGAGSLEERRRLLETARETLARGRVGGHTGVPGGAGRR